MPNLIVDAIVIAIVSYVINISQASLFAKKSGYKINSNQVSCYYMEGQTSYMQAVFVLLRSL